jgi:hypothetical protein
MPREAAIVGVLSCTSTPTVGYSSPFPANVREPIPPKGTEPKRGGHHNFRRPREGGQAPSAKKVTTTSFPPGVSVEKSGVAPGSQTKCDPDWLLVSSRLTGRSYVRGRKPVRNDQRSVYRSLGFITVKFAPQRKIPRSGKATTACSDAPRVDFFCGHHIGNARRTRHGET